MSLLCVTSALKSFFNITCQAGCVCNHGWGAVCFGDREIGFLHFPANPCPLQNPHNLWDTVTLNTKIRVCFFLSPLPNIPAIAEFCVTVWAQVFSA